MIGECDILISIQMYFIDKIIKLGFLIYIVKFLYLQLLVPAKRDGAGTELHSRLIRIDFSLTKKPHNPTPGLYLDRGGSGGGHGHDGRKGHDGSTSGMGGEMHDSHGNGGGNTKTKSYEYFWHE